MDTDEVPVPALFSPDRLEQLTAIHRALGDKTRMRMVLTMMAGELCVGELARSMEMTESAI